MKMLGISASRINTFLMCVFKYFLTYHLKAKMKSNFGALNGTIVHCILERLANKEDTDWTDQLYRGYAGTLEVTNNFDQLEILQSPLIYAKPKEYAQVKPHCDSCPYNTPCVTHGREPYSDANASKCRISQEPLNRLSGCPKGLFEETLEMLRLAVAKYQPLFDKHLLATEEKIVFELLGCPAPITCIVDLVIRRGDTVELIDYKAGKWTHNYEECREDVQVRTVSLAGRKKYIGKDGIKNVVLTFDYFRNQPITLSFTEEEDAEHEQYLIKQGQEIKGQKRVTRIMRNPDRFWKCKVMCDPEVCNKQWNGVLTLDENDEVMS